jgi:hypothetical protein
MRDKTNSGTNCFCGKFYKSLKFLERVKNSQSILEVGKKFNFKVRQWKMTGSKHTYEHRYLYSK